MCRVHTGPRAARAWGLAMGKGRNPLPAAVRKRGRETGRRKAENKQIKKARLTKPPTPKSPSPLEQGLEWLDRAALLCPPLHPHPILGLEGSPDLPGPSPLFLNKSPIYRERGSVFLKE